MVTTSYVDSQAYKEVIDDGHTILVVSASDIAAVLRSNSIHPSDMQHWLTSIGTRRSKQYSFGSNELPRVAEEVLGYKG